MFALAPASLTWIPAIIGLIVGAAWLFVAYKVDITRFYLMALLSVFLGAGISLAGFGDILGLALFYAVMAFVLIISGGTTLYKYLRSTQPPEEPISPTFHSAEENSL